MSVSIQREEAEEAEEELFEELLCFDCTLSSEAAILYL